jgi:hypothetical protein
MDLDQTIISMPVCWAEIRAADAAGEPQLCPARSGIAAYYDPTL